MKILVIIFAIIYLIGGLTFIYGALTAPIKKDEESLHSNN